MILILLKSSIVVAISLLLYKMILQQESYFSSHRLYLVVGLICALVLPFVTLPEIIEGQGVISERITTIVSQESQQGPIPYADHAESDVLTPSNETESSTLHWSTWLTYVYLFGLMVFSINLLLQVFSLLRQIAKHGISTTKNGIHIVDVAMDQPPCSFFNYILINRAKYDDQTLRQIIAHEEIHVMKRHSLDLLLSEIMVAILWFNPFIYWYRSEVEKNIEFETDQTVLDQKNFDRENYQMSLLEVSRKYKPLAITTNYNQSLLKERIMRMNARKSNAHSYWKYVFYVPVLFALLVFLNKPRTLYSQSQNVDVIQSAQELSGENTCQNLLRATKQGNAKKVKDLLQSVDPNCSYYDDGEPRSPLVAAARKGDMAMADLLLNANADVEYHARGDESPLMAAAANGSLALVTRLLEAGAKVNRKVKGDGTALIASVRNRHLEVTRLLLEKGADPYLAVPGDEYAMYHARTSGNQSMIKLLEKYTDD